MKGGVLLTYQFYYQSKNMIFAIERYSHNKIPYYTKKEMYKLHPNGDYEVIGEIGNLAKVYVGQDVIETDMGKNIHIFPRGSLKVPFEWVAGYAAVGESTYVAVIKSVISWFIC